MIATDQSSTPEDLENLEAVDYYAKWQKKEGVRVIHDYLFESLKDLALGDWPRKGGRGAIINIPYDIHRNDSHVVEIRAGGCSEPEHHMYEELVYVLAGRGATSIWWDEQQKQTFEWGAGSLFSIPLNAWYQHFNGSGSEPARYIAVTDLPPTLRHYQNMDFVFDNPFRFTDRFGGESGFFDGEGKLYKGRWWQTNFIPDAVNLQLYSWKERGAGGINAMLELPNRNLHSHISEFPVGTYKKAHRHHPGTHLLILSGDGFSLFWMEGDKRRKCDWQQGGMVIVPELGCFHQHFNTGATRARYLAMGGGDDGMRAPKRGGTGGDTDLKQGGAQIEYEDEDPDIHHLFESELARHGATCRMKSFSPYCTGQ